MPKFPESPDAAMPVRRRLLLSLTGVAAGLGLSARAAHAVTDLEDAADGDAWMKPLTGKHRQFFHAMTIAEEPLRMAHNFLDAYRDAFGARPKDVNAVIGVHGSALFLGFNDALWSKYGFGKSAGFDDPATKAPAVRNVFASGGPYTVEALRKRGVAFIMCNTALRNRTRMMANALGVPYDTLYAELSGGRLPGFMLVPAMVVAVSRAQERGFTYIRAS